MKSPYPFLISVPHGGTEIPASVKPLLAVSEDELQCDCDPLTRDIFGYGERVMAYADTEISRMIVDLNRPPLPLPPKDPDGIIKSRTADGKDIWLPGKIPDIAHIHRLLMAHYFPYHQRIDELFDQHPIAIAFDCHSMLPTGSPGQKDAGKTRPLICLGNNGDKMGRPHKGGVATCPEEWIRSLADAFGREFSGSVAINDPFSGGFIANAHYWHKGVPWVQVEVNRGLYEGASGSLSTRELREKVWGVMVGWWERRENIPEGK